MDIPDTVTMHYAKYEINVHYILHSYQLLLIVSWLLYERPLARSLTWAATLPVLCSSVQDRFTRNVETSNITFNIGSMVMQMQRIGL